MTAFISLRYDDRIIVYSDGATYDDAGHYRGPVQKCNIVFHVPALIFTRGSAWFGEAFRLLSSRFATFDDLVKGAVPLITQAYCLIEASGEERNLAVFIAGYSEERQRWETYEVRMSPDDGVISDDGKPIPLPEVYWAPHPEHEIAERLGCFEEGKVKFHTDDRCVRFLEAVRQSTLGLHPHTEMRGCMVGAFIQKTVLMKTAALSSIIYRWPDVVGEVLDPARAGAWVPGSAADQEYG